MPPETAEKTGPASAATVPDSNAPSSLEAPMKTPFSADTRPRMLSGVSTWMSVVRTTTLMLSQAPRKNSMTSENQNTLEMPNNAVTAPKPATAKSNVRPARRSGPRCACNNAMLNAPTAGAVTNHPRPRGPTCRMSLA